MLQRGCILNEACQSIRNTFLWQDYQSFLEHVANGTQNRDIDGWKFWQFEEFEQLDSVKAKYGQAAHCNESNPECYIVFADYCDGEKFLCIRKFRPKLDFPVIHIIHGLEIKPYANNFEEFVINYKSKKGYSSNDNA